MDRKDLKPWQAYYVASDDLYFWSPDGIGGYWYDTLEELEGECGISSPRRVIEIEELFD